MEDRIYRQARRRVNKKKAFYAHFSVYISVGIFFLAINLVTNPWDLWFFFPMIPWGAGLLIHYFTTFGLPGKEQALTQKWEEREMEKEIQRLRRMEGLREEAPPEQLDLPDLQKPPQRVKLKKWEEDDLV